MAARSSSLAALAHAPGDRPRVGIGQIARDVVVRFRPGRDEMPGPPGGMRRREAGRQGAVRLAALLVGGGGVDGRAH